MSFITLDFETFFRSKANKGSPGEKYSLRGMTYEEYIRDERFYVQGVGIKINAQPTTWVFEDIEGVLSRLFFKGNDHIMLCHNTMFDGAILSWYYGLAAGKYFCTQAMARAVWNGASTSLDAVTKKLFPDDPSKWKGKELESVDGFRVLTNEQNKVLGGYCIQDCDITFDVFSEFYKFFPDEELNVMDHTLKMFIHPRLILDEERVIAYDKKLQQKLIDDVKESGISETTLSSNLKFTQHLLDNYGIDIPYIPSPTKKNPDNTKLALAKDDLEFLEIRAQHPELEHIWKGRITVKSTIERSRAPRLLSHAKKSHINRNGAIAVPLQYCGAMTTKRWSGTNKVNFQNFGRGSELRKSLCAPKGHKVIVRDLSNIEGRINAWFHQQEDKLQIFKEGGDIYNALATKIYGRPIDRKLKSKNEQGEFLDDDGNVTDYDNAHEPDWLEGFVGKQAELGLGYQMGAPKFRTTLLKFGVTLDLPFVKKIVGTYRTTNYKIHAGWKNAERYIFDMASKDMEPYDVGCIRIERERIRLPNGLYLTYPGLKMVEDEEGRRQFVYWNGQFWKGLYGGILVENLIQALSRLIMSWQMLRIIERITPLGGVVVLLVHDETVAIGPDEHADEILEIMGEEMATCPEWCDDGTLTLDSEGGYAQNYSK